MSTPRPIDRPPVPGFVQRTTGLVQRLLRLGLPMGPNALLTAVGRRSGLSRTVPVAILETDGRQYVFAAFGETGWVHNVRAAGTATVRRGRREQSVRTVELDPGMAAPVLEAGLRPVMRVPFIGPMIAGWYGIDRRSTRADYDRAARLHPAFELTPIDAG